MAQQKIWVSEGRGDYIIRKKMSSKITLPLLNSKPGAKLGESFYDVLMDQRTFGVLI